MLGWYGLLTAYRFYNFFDHIKPVQMCITATMGVAVNLV